MAFKFQILLPRSNGFVLLIQQEYLFKAEQFFQGLDEADTTTRKRWPEVDEAIGFPAYSMLESVSKVISDKSIHSLCNKWREPGNDHF